MGTIQQFVEQHGIKLSHEYADRNPYWSDDTPANHYKVRLSCQKRRYTFFYSMGIGHTEPPNAVDVLDCLASDAAGVENARSFEYWAGDYGYDTDSRKAYRIYLACEREVKNLERLLGSEAYQELLWNTERL